MGIFGLAIVEALRPGARVLSHSGRPPRWVFWPREWTSGRRRPLTSPLAGGTCPRPKHPAGTPPTGATRAPGLRLSATQGLGVNRNGSDPIRFSLTRSASRPVERRADARVTRWRGTRSAFWRRASATCQGSDQWPSPVGWPLRPPKRRVGSICVAWSRGNLRMPGGAGANHGVEDGEGASICLRPRLPSSGAWVAI